MAGWPSAFFLTVVLLTFAPVILVLAGYHEAALLRDERALAAGRVEKAVRDKKSIMRTCGSPRAMAARWPPRSPPGTTFPPGVIA